jgi:hypothetical protein
VKNIVNDAGRCGGLDLYTSTEEAMAIQSTDLSSQLRLSKCKVYHLEF